MKKKLSQKEREETVTKGFLSDCLEDTVTKGFLSDCLKDYVTKDYLTETINNAMEKQAKDFYQHMDALMEHHMHMLQVFMENMDDRYVLRKEWLVHRV
jgi:hypothetical protein